MAACTPGNDWGTDGRIFFFPPDFDLKPMGIFENTVKFVTDLHFAVLRVTNAAGPYVFRNGLPNQSYPPADAIKPQPVESAASDHQIPYSPLPNVVTLEPFESHKGEQRKNATSFLDLPQELRDMVYENCFQIAGVICVRDQHQDAIIGLGPMVLPNFRFETYVPPSMRNVRCGHDGDELSTLSDMEMWDRSGGPNDYTTRQKLRGHGVDHSFIDLLSVCRQVHFEAAQIFYGHVFEFSQSSGCFKPLQSVSIASLSGLYAPMVKNLRFQFTWTDLRTTRNTWPKFCAEGFPQMLQVFPNLKTLTIVLPKHPQVTYPWEREKSESEDEEEEEDESDTDSQLIVTRGVRKIYDRKTILEPEDFQQRLAVWFTSTFWTGNAEVSDKIHFEIEDTSIDRVLVKRAWAKFKEWQTQIWQKASAPSTR
ncbi:hypothetical protein NA57DRAFT_61359 [Rhizodiscina lignyota]|uniref:DUF7730 domain-containing protein n=1 Tax=Rhizodiscina lignyota TaxID=1504668 RepID=A0A9P4M5A7_9PEZI|nr:hypothetical protein NA57DRAFT_61359 [Rhizodiscina lignyota]